MTKKQTVNFKELSAEQCIEHAFNECFKDMKFEHDFKVIRNSADLLQVKMTSKDFDNMLFDVKAWTAKNKFEDYSRYFIICAYELAVDKIAVKHDTYEFERIGGNRGYYILTFNKYAEPDQNPYTVKRLEYEYIFREHEVQGV